MSQIVIGSLHAAIDGLTVRADDPAGPTIATCKRFIRPVGVFCFYAFQSFVNAYCAGNLPFPSKSRYSWSKSLLWPTISLIRHRTFSELVPLDSPVRDTQKTVPYWVSSSYRFGVMAVQNLNPHPKPPSPSIRMLYTLKDEGFPMGWKGIEVISGSCRAGSG